MNTFQEHYTILNDLALQFGTDKGSQCHNYTRTYAKLLGPIREQVTSVLEIGLCRRNWEGNRHVYPSLMVWREFFPHAAIHGADKRLFKSDDSRVKISQTDQSNAKELAVLAESVGAADIIIDDGSHVAGDQILTLNALWPILKPGGIYVIEDLKCTRNVPEPELVLTRFKKHARDGTFPVPGCMQLGFAPSDEKGEDSLVWLRKESI